MGSPISLQGQGQEEEKEFGKQFHAARMGKYQSQLKWVESVISRAAKVYLYQLGGAKDMHSAIIVLRVPPISCWVTERQCWTSVEHIHVFWFGAWFYGLWGGGTGRGNMESDSMRPDVQKVHKMEVMVFGHICRLGKI